MSKAAVRREKEAKVCDRGVLAKNFMTANQVLCVLAAVIKFFVRRDLEALALYSFVNE
jgi:hypothetical protein